MISACETCKFKKERSVGFRTFIGCTDKEKEKNNFYYDKYFFHHSCDAYKKEEKNNN